MQNRVVGVEDTTMRWSESADDVRNITVSYFSTIFSSSQPVHIDEVTQCVDAKVTDQQNHDLLASVMDGEVEDVKVL